LRRGIELKGGLMRHIIKYCFVFSVFAYGATGAGKTFTMLGNYQNPGVMFLTMMDLYQRIDDMKNDKTCDVAVSYLEVTSNIS
jgi:kinesin family protein 18/19